MIEELREEVLKRLDISKEVKDEEILECIDEVITKKSREEYLSLSVRRQLRKNIFDSLRRLDILQELLDYRNYGKWISGYFCGEKGRNGTSGIAIRIQRKVGGYYTADSI